MESGTIASDRKTTASLPPALLYFARSGYDGMSSHLLPLPVLPQCPLLADLSTDTFYLWWHATSWRATTRAVFFFCFSSLYPQHPPSQKKNISSLLILRRGRHHFHANQRFHGNWPKEVITQVISVTDDEKLAPDQVLFIRGQMAFFHGEHCPYMECQSAALSARRMESQRQIIVFGLPVIVHTLPPSTPLSPCGQRSPSLLVRSGVTQPLGATWVTHPELRSIRTIKRDTAS